MFFWKSVNQPTTVVGGGQTVMTAYSTITVATKAMGAKPPTFKMPFQRESTVSTLGSSAGWLFPVLFVLFRLSRPLYLRFGFIRLHTNSQ